MGRRFTIDLRDKNGQSLCEIVMCTVSFDFKADNLEHMSGGHV